jgi:hypothetical protein
LRSADYPSDKNQSLGTPVFHPSDDDLSLGTPVSRRTQVEKRNEHSDQVWDLRVEGDCGG